MGENCPSPGAVHRKYDIKKIDELELFGVITGVTGTRCFGEAIHID
jgi:hypothetical protein